MERVSPGSGGDVGREDTKYFESGLGSGLLGSLVMAAVFSTTIFAGVLGWIVAGIFVPLFIVGAIVALWELIRHKPMLVITDHGIRHQRFGYVPWTAVDHVWIRTDREGDQPITPIVVELNGTDPEFASTASLDIRLNNLSVSYESILKAMSEHNPQLIAWVH
ncbi:hypothetical protein [Nocardia sp. NPDC057668]|uniref:hypothetical protein n=1 Tax=Nocardia sp. NPDC057668 TaxID=3346202 RepID=UPI00366B2430